jgi:hypothetical protein
VGRPLWQEYVSVIFTCYLRLPFSSPPTTRRATVEVFDLTSTQVNSRLVLLNKPKHLGTGRIENTSPDSSSIVASRSCHMDHIENTSSQLLHWCVQPLSSSSHCLQSLLSSRSTCYNMMLVSSHLPSFMFSVTWLSCFSVSFIEQYLLMIKSMIMTVAAWITLNWMNHWWFEKL